MNLATRRLIDASATLPAADRALLSLWTQQGLSDAALARMTGVTPAAIVGRRERIVIALSAELGLPPEDVSGALTGIAASAAAPRGEPRLASAGSSPVPVAEDVLPPEKPETNPQVEPQPSRAEAVPEGQARSRRTAAEQERRRLTLAVLVILLAVAALVVIVLVAGAHSKGSAQARRQGPTSAARTSTGPIAPASSSAPGPQAGKAARLIPLPGGDPRASGTIALTGTGARRTLRVSVRGLPDPAPGHYEVFLYDSIIDSEPVGELPAVGRMAFRLPADAAHYAFIDISRQLTGNAIPDGASTLRAPNPAHGR